LRHSLLITLIAFLVAACFAPARAASGPPYPIGFKQIEFTDGDRHIALAMFYPAEVTDKSATPTGLPSACISTGTPSYARAATSW
jgi:hypothetical protein